MYLTFLGLLSSNLCSLRGGEERLAFSCVWEVTPNAEIINSSFTKSVIKSKAAMTYEQAQLVIDDQNQNTPIAIGLRQLNKFAKILKKRRIDAGYYIYSMNQYIIIQILDTFVLFLINFLFVFVHFLEH